MTAISLLCAWCHQEDGPEHPPGGQCLIPDNFYPLPPEKPPPPDIKRKDIEAILVDLAERRRNNKFHAEKAETEKDWPKALLFEAEACAYAFAVSAIALRIGMQAIGDKWDEKGIAHHQRATLFKNNANGRTRASATS